jgi:hypothetical protein
MFWVLCSSGDLCNLRYAQQIFVGKTGLTEDKAWGIFARFVNITIEIKSGWKTEEEAKEQIKLISSLLEVEDLS